MIFFSPAPIVADTDWTSPHPEPWAPHSTPSGPADIMPQPTTDALPTFSAARLARLAELEHWHYWFLARVELVRRAIQRHLGNREAIILDIGCGTGSFLSALTDDGHRVIGVDYRREGLLQMRPNLPTALLSQADAMHLPLASDTLELVLLLDVLEHVRDDQAIAEARRVLRTGGSAIVTVPALAWLWSYRDEAAGHLRRYSRKRLSDLATDANLEIREIRHFHFLLLPVLAISRLLGRRGPWWRDLEERRIPLLSNLMALVSRVEVGLSEFVSWPVGSSILAVFSKPR